MSGFDWPGLMRAGIGAAGLRPDEFWRLTPAELVLMLGDPGAAAPLDRVRLMELARAWPDGIKEDGNGSDGWSGRVGPADGGA
jgi:uncharacterized phage protein (TIGR02216 family)